MRTRLRSVKPQLAERLVKITPSTRGSPGSSARYRDAACDAPRKQHLFKERRLPSRRVCIVGDLEVAARRSPATRARVCSTYCGTNSPPRHFGQGGATSFKAGRVKCFTLPQLTQRQPSARISLRVARSERASCASSRMRFKTARSESIWSAIRGVRVEWGEGRTGDVVRRATDAQRLSCSCEHRPPAEHVDQIVVLGH